VFVGRQQTERPRKSCMKRESGLAAGECPCTLCPALSIRLLSNASSRSSGSVYIVTYIYMPVDRLFALEIRFT
jgi:hypothetical protein